MAPLRLFPIVLVVCTVLVGTAPHAAARQESEQPASAAQALLLGVDVEVEVESPTRARVDATVTVRGNASFDLLWTLFPGQRLEELDARVGARAIVGLPTTGRTRRLTVSPVAAMADAEVRLRLVYWIVTGTEWTHRFPLPVPEVASEASEPIVHLRVRLPPGSDFAGDAFPRLRRGAGSGAALDILVAELVSVPAFVHVVFGDAARGLGRHRLIELAAIGVAVVLLALLGLRARAAVGRAP